MSHADLIDFDSLLSPFDGDSPAGQDLRDERTDEFSAIRDARRSASAAERDAALDPSRMSDALAEWRSIRALANTILTSQSKDLEVAAWYLESLVREYGIDGFIAGTRLINELIGRYWNDIYPLPDEDDGSEARIKPLLGVFGGDSEGTLLSALRTLAIVPEGNGNDNVDTFQFWHYDSAQQASRIEAADKRAEKYERLGFSLDDIERSVASAPDAFYHNLVAGCETALQTLAELNEAILALAKQDRSLPTPTISAVRTLISDDYLAALKHLARDKLNRPEPVAEAPAPAESAPTMTASTPSHGAAVAVPVGAIANRDQALAQLTEIARFFRLTEPHTPLVGALERVIRWGRMPLPDLMLELLPGDQSRQIYSQLTGIDLNNGATGGTIPPVPTYQETYSAPAASTDSYADSGSSSHSDSEW